MRSTKSHETRSWIVRTTWSSFSLAIMQRNFRDRILGQNHTFFARYHPADLIARINLALDSGFVCWRANNYHPDTHVEGAKHLALFDVSDAPHRFKDWHHGPRAAFDFHARSCRQNARDVFAQASAGDVRESFNNSAVEQPLEGAQITYVRFQKRCADCS